MWHFVPWEPTVPVYNGWHSLFITNPTAGVKLVSVAVLWFLTPDLWFSRDKFDHI